MRNEIWFCSVADAYGDFSNFARFAIRLDGKQWPTSEHYFRAMKMTDARHREEVRRANTPALAARAGRNRKYRIRRDWESARFDVMRKALWAKFTQHSVLAKLLQSTGEAVLVEHTEQDAFWGDGGDGHGQNWLGRILMETRTMLLLKHKECAGASSQTHPRR